MFSAAINAPLITRAGIDNNGVSVVWMVRFWKVIYFVTFNLHLYMRLEISICTICGFFFTVSTSLTPAHVIRLSATLSIPISLEYLLWWLVGVAHL